MAEPESLRELFLRDFGIDLPITGEGGTVDSPFTISAESIQEAVDVQIQSLNCLTQGQGVGWRLLSQEVLGNDPVRTRVRIETVELTSEQIISETKRYYFVWDGAAAHESVQTLPGPSDFIDPRSGIALPYELGWLHIAGTTNFEAQRPGLGISVAYAGITAQATLYIYDQGDSIGPANTDRIEAEFSYSTRDALRAIEGSQLKGMGPVDNERGKSPRYLALIHAPPDRASAVFLSVHQGQFVKARITWLAEDSQTHSIGERVLKAVGNLFRNSEEQCN